MYNKIKSQLKIMTQIITPILCEQRFIAVMSVSCTAHVHGTQHTSAGILHYSDSSISPMLLLTSNSATAVYLNTNKLPVSSSSALNY